MKSLFLAAVLLSSAGVAHAAGPCGAGQYVTMRVSKLSPGGTRAGFEAAARDHAAWYAANGLRDDRFVTGPTIVPVRGGQQPSATQFVTMHVYGGGQPKRDAAWAAYVAKYKANSTIVSETRFCLPKGVSIAVR